MPVRLRRLAPLLLLLTSIPLPQSRGAGAGRGPEQRGETPGAAAADPAGEAAQEAQPAARPPEGEVYVNDRFGYALRRPRSWSYRLEPGIDIIMAPADRRAEIQVVARTFLDIGFQNIPEGSLTLTVRADARQSAEPFRALRKCVPPALHEFLQLFWLDAYVAWHTSATAEEYEEFHLESKKETRLSGHGGVELVYTLKGKRRPGTQRVKTVIVAFDERICQLSYISNLSRYEDDLSAFHEVVRSLYLHRDRG